MMRFRKATRRLLTLASVGVVWSAASSIVAPSSTETAVANGDTRTIHFYHTHTGESIDATFRVDGHYDQAVLDKLNYFLRDWRNNDQIRMDPRLFDTVWEVYRTAGADQPIQIYSAYRSPETNAMLRRRSRAVAEHSQHMLGKAMDTTMPGMSMEKIREIGMRLQHGGVGYYQSANFVHLDVGGVRSWPRMNYDQLARLFPDGKTVHIPSNGQPMARYEEARAEIAARGGTEVPPAQESQGFFAWLFGGGGNGSAHEDGADRTATAARIQTAALADPEGDEGPAKGSRGAAPLRQPTPPQPVAQPEPPARSTVASLREDEAPPTVQAAVAEEKAADPAETVFPVPPRRPTDLFAVAALDDMPLPPVRHDPTANAQVASAETAALPTPLSRPAQVPDAIGGLIGQTVPQTRRGGLPAIITQGSADNRVPSSILAFAAPETTASLRPALQSFGARPATAARSLPQHGIVALRRGRRIEQQPIVPGSAHATAPLATPAPSVTAIVGLRRAAKSATVDAAL